LRKVYIDTNVFDYVALRHEVYGEACKRVLSDIGKRIEAYCSYLVPIEMLGSLSEIDKELALKAVKAFFSFDIHLIELDELVIFLAGEICKKWRINGYDAVHAAAMRKANIRTIITENVRDFKKVPWIKVVRPIEYEKWISK